jgi:acyl carrier protein
MDFTAPEVGSRLIALLKNILGPDAALPEPLPLDAQLNHLGVSSLKMVNLMLAVESEFDLNIPQADITPENFHSLQTIGRLVLRLRGLI